MQERGEDEVGIARERERGIQRDESGSQRRVPVEIGSENAGVDLLKVREG